MKAMKVLFLVALCLCLAAPAVAGKIKVEQDQSQAVIQGQASVGGFSAASQGYATGATQGYVINKSGNPSGVAVGSTASTTHGNQIKFGNGFQVEGMIGHTTNDGKLSW
jgi:hypothetical protein